MVYHCVDVLWPRAVEKMFRIAMIYSWMTKVIEPWAEDQQKMYFSKPATTIGGEDDNNSAVVQLRQRNDHDIHTQDVRDSGSGNKLRGLTALVVVSVRISRGWRRKRRRNKCDQIFEKFSSRWTLTLMIVVG